MLAAVTMAGVDAATQDAGRDLWVGVIRYDDTSVEGEATRVSSGIEPIGALVGGRWWFGAEPETDQPLPTTWQGFLFDGRRLDIRTSGTVRRTRFDELSVAADLPTPADATLYVGMGAAGVVVAGDVQVTFFEEMKDAERRVLFKSLAPALLRAEREEFARVARFNGDQQMLRQAPRRPAYVYAEIDWETSLVATEADGSRVSVIEGVRREPKWSPIQVGAAARRTRTGKVEVLSTWASFTHDDMDVQHRPLAFVERAGRSCWLTNFAYEDGMEYGLFPPGLVGDEDARSQCEIR